MLGADALEVRPKAKAIPTQSKSIGRSVKGLAKLHS
jgi:hypothetical protein